MKFQWSKASAIFGDYKQILSNWEMTVNSAGFTNEQVGIQMDTLARKAKTLKAELDGVFGGIGNAGLGDFLKGTTVSLTNFTRGLKESSTTAFKTVEALVALAGLFVIVKTAVEGGSFVYGVLKANTMLATEATIGQIAIEAVKISSSAGVVNGLKNQAIAEGMLAASTKSLTGVGAVTGLLMANWPILLGLIAFGIYEVVAAQGEASRNQDILNGRSQEENELLLKQMEVGKQKISFIETLAGQYNKLGASIDTNSGQTAENIKKQEEQQTILEILKRQTGLNTDELVKDGVIQQDTIDAIKKKSKEEAEANLNNNIAKMQADVAATQQFILDTQSRIDGIKVEVGDVGILAKAYDALYLAMSKRQTEAADELDKYADGGIDAASVGTDVGSFGPTPGGPQTNGQIPANWQPSEDQQQQARQEAKDLRASSANLLAQSGQAGVADLKGQIADANVTITKLSGQIVATQGQLDAINNTNGGEKVKTGETTDPADKATKPKAEKAGASTPETHTEQLKYMQDQAEYRSLLAAIDIAEKKHEDRLKDLSTQEAIYGNTVGLTILKQKETTDHIAELGSQYTTLETLKQKYISQLNEELSTNQELNATVSEAIPNWSSLTRVQQREQIKLNSELFQTFKTADNLNKLIGDIDGKQTGLHTTANASRDDLKKENLGGTQDVMKQSNRRISGIKDQETIDLSNQTDKVNPNNDVQLNQTRLNALKDQQVEYDAQVVYLDSQAKEAMKKSDIALQQSTADALKKGLVAQTENATAIKNLEYSKDTKIRDGLEGITSDILLKGNKMRNIWKSLWTGLADDALKSLFKVQNSSGGLLSSLFGLLGGGGGKTSSSSGGYDVTKGGGFFGLKAFADGGETNGTSIAGEDGKEVVIPIEKNTGNSANLLQYASKQLGVSTSTDVSASVSQSTVDTAQQVSQNASVSREHITELQKSNEIMQKQLSVMQYMANSGSNQGTTVAQPIVVSNAQSNDDLQAQMSRMRLQGYTL